MSEDTPVLSPSAQEMFQWAQALSLIRDRLASRRREQGRLAFGDAEHAARFADAQAAGVAVRVMNPEQEAAWTAAVPTTQLNPGRRQGCTTWCAPLDEGGWGLEARTWDTRGAPTGALFVVCRSQEDAVGLRKHLEQHGDEAELERLRAAASRPLPTIAGFPPAERDAGTSAVTSAANTAASNNILEPDEWARVLQENLPASLSRALVDADPAHPHAGARGQLYRLAAGEVERIDAVPERLVHLISSVPRWNTEVRNPAALACWALVQARTDPAYATTVTREPGPTELDAPPAQRGESPRLDEVNSHASALAWARGLHSGDAAHQVEAHRGWGQFGAEVDSELIARFPDIMPAAENARRQHSPEQRTQVHALAVQHAELANFVDQLDADKPADRLSARTMLGRTDPEIDRLLHAKFHGDAGFDARVLEHYPAGAEDVEAVAAAWRSRADDEAGRAAEQRAQPDVPETVLREDQVGQRDATRHELGAERDYATAANLAAQPVQRSRPLHRR